MATIVVGLPAEIDSIPTTGDPSTLPSKTPTGRLRNPVSQIVGEILKTNSIATAPTANISGGTDGTTGDWPVYIANAPNVPDNILTIFDTEGVKDGRIMIGGMTVKHPGIQIQIRSYDYLVGWDKANAVMVSLSEKVHNMKVILSGSTYMVYALSITSGPISLGKEVSDSKRYLFTVNATVSLIKRTT